MGDHALRRPLREPRSASLGSRLRIRLNLMEGWLYAHTKGRVGGKIAGQPVLLLTTTGRRTGRPRRTPVQYQSLRDGVFLVAAGGGSSLAPAWWHNLQADPHASVQIGGARYSARASTLSHEERDEVWPRLCERNGGLLRAQKRAGRELPIVRVRLAAHAGD